MPIGIKNDSNVMAMRTIEEGVVFAGKVGRQERASQQCVAFGKALAIEHRKRAGNAEAGQMAMCGEGGAPVVGMGYVNRKRRALGRGLPFDRPVAEGIAQA